MSGKAKYQCFQWPQCYDELENRHLCRQSAQNLPFCFTAFLLNKRLHLWGTWEILLLDLFSAPVLLPGLVLVTPPTPLPTQKPWRPSARQLPRGDRSQCCFPGFAIHLGILRTGVGWTPTLLPASPPQGERETGLESWVLKEEVAFHRQPGTLLRGTAGSTSFPNISRTLQRKHYCGSEKLHCGEKTLLTQCGDAPACSNPRQA